MRPLAATVFLFCAVFWANAQAQVRLQPQPPPTTSAVNQDWYLSAEPLPIFGDLYYPTGPTVFFRANEMVPIATYGGVTLYGDTTLEPFSIVYVPIGRGLMRPYERRRAGALAGTVGSTMPSFPIQRDSDVRVAVNPLIAPSAALPAPPPATTASTVLPSGLAIAPEPRPIGTAGTAAAAPARTRMTTLTRPRSTTGVWIEFAGDRWRAAGKAQEFVEGRFVRYGEYSGVPVYVERESAASRPHRIFLPMANGLVTPYVRVR